MQTKSAAAALLVGLMLGGAAVLSNREQSSPAMNELIGELRADQRKAYWCCLEAEEADQPRFPSAYWRGVRYGLRVAESRARATTDSNARPVEELLRCP